MGKFGTFIKKTSALIAGAAVFGVVAGGTFNLVADTDGINNANKSDESVTGFFEDFVDASGLIKDGVKGEYDEIPSTPVVNTSGSSGMDVSQIVQSVMPSIVSINVTAVVKYDSFFYGGYEYETPGSGSGIIIGQNDSELLVVTNNHVVEDAKTVNVCFIDEESYEATVKSTDSDNDLAIVVVKLSDISEDTMSKIEVAKLGSSDKILVGEQVVAIGNALGYGQSVTTGIISGKDRVVSTNVTPLIQTDAAINPGNSGGALINMKGEVIGINSSKYMSTEVEGVGYAIPISKVDSIIDNLKNRKTREKVEDESKRGYLGIKGSTISEEASQMYNLPSGIYVSSVVEGSAADKAGIKKDYIITEFDGISVSSIDDLVDRLTYYRAGEKVDVKVLVPFGNTYNEKEIKVQLGSKDDTSNDKES